MTTNVPGPHLPLDAAGREMLEYLPVVPLGPGVRIGVAILSYNGRLRFGITGDYDTAPDIEILADGVDAAVKSLLRLARRRPRRDGGRPHRPRRGGRSATKPVGARASR